MRILVNVLLFVLPFLIYVGWLHAKEKSPFLKEHWERRPVVWLGLAGLLLGGGFFVYHLYRQDRDPTAVYVPARVENGVFYPARMEPRRPASQP